MRMRLQLKIPFLLGLLLFCGHSAVVILLGYVAQRNIEMGVLWNHLHLTDLPVSLLMDRFYDLFLKVFPQWTYPAPEVVFHLIFGGIQFFIWGCLIGICWNLLTYQRTPCESSNKSPSTKG